MFLLFSCKGKELWKTMLCSWYMVDERGFEEQFCKMVSSCIDLDTHEDHPVFFDVPKFSRKCDFYEKVAIQSVCV